MTPITTLRPCSQTVPGTGSNSLDNSMVKNPRLVYVDERTSQAHYPFEEKFLLFT